MFIYFWSNKKLWPAWVKKRESNKNMTNQTHKLNSPMKHKHTLLLMVNHVNDRWRESCWSPLRSPDCRMKVSVHLQKNQSLLVVSIHRTEREVKTIWGWANILGGPERERVRKSERWGWGRLPASQMWEEENPVKTSTSMGYKRRCSNRQKSSSDNKFLPVQVKHKCWY